MALPPERPIEIDASTGLPAREVASAVSANPDPARVESARRFAVAAARTLSDDKCEKIEVLDLRGQSQVTDFMVIASGTSERQMRSAGFHVEEAASGFGLATFRTNLKQGPSNWLFVDFVDVVVHVFEPETRAHYDLEMLWGDASRVRWERNGEAHGLERNRAGLRPGEVVP